MGTRTKKKQYQINDEILSKPSSKSLGRVLYEDQEIKKYGSVKSKNSNKSYKKERQKQLDNEYMDEKTSKRILELSREQLLEEEEEEKNNEGSNRMINSTSGNNNNKKGFDNNLARKNRNDNDSSDDDEEEDDDVI